LEKGYVAAKMLIHGMDFNEIYGVRLGKGKYPTLRLFFNHQLLANCPSGGAMPFLRPKPSDYVHHATDLYESRQNQKRTV
ncbi:hypothetical protein ACSQOM_005494, partial [Klebsiella pneumoniae]